MVTRLLGKLDQHLDQRTIWVGIGIKQTETTGRRLIDHEDVVQTICCRCQWAGEWAWWGCMIALTHLVKK